MYLGWYQTLFTGIFPGNVGEVWHHLVLGMPQTLAHSLAHWVTARSHAFLMCGHVTWSVGALLAV